MTGSAFIGPIEKNMQGKKTTKPFFLCARQKWTRTCIKTYGRALITEGD